MYGVFLAVIYGFTAVVGLIAAMLVQIPSTPASGEHVHCIITGLEFPAPVAIVTSSLAFLAQIVAYTAKARKEALGSQYHQLREDLATNKRSMRRSSVISHLSTMENHMADEGGALKKPRGATNFEDAEWHDNFFVFPCLVMTIVSLVLLPLDIVTSLTEHWKTRAWRTCLFIMFYCLVQLQGMILLMLFAFTEPTRAVLAEIVARLPSWGNKDEEE
mmetsp:Transcript_54763/g.97675  ORF Transcript_54763/g.97675 Transcript_54763/m.97675 type:complete len:217 (+) Transcript_54763:1-651(+)